MRTQPLIVTLELEAADQAYFSIQRQAYFPAHRNYLDAHLTLFYHLPAAEPAVLACLEAAAHRPPMSLRVEGPAYMGIGVAYGLRSEELAAWHAGLQQQLDPWLKRQDRKILWPHITIQNRVTAFKAQLLYDKLRADFEPFDITARGLRTWLYFYGPWKPLAYYPFQNGSVDRHGA
ncbi:2'-5' RNA ligase family protein [Taibaiella chishuiensis]|uniref:2'-5' RNA ligase superfamily protein n=1 Tax=Taibaiella chishuiensis TaxID=1434707 RepID=A0A2P8D7Z8_9BACT|nr:2'-5' RNA ligase family protein [Taibaiella chishuiensis]PSK93333.1 2'-5' RNA ligase superfamily protein [Taibaiella chishuiensis]